jgi:hypothetical protein
LAIGAAALAVGRLGLDEVEGKRKRRGHRRASAQAVTLDPATGTGFIGKGDVQLACGFNNKQLQDFVQTVGNGSVQFRVNSTSVTEVSWTCTNDRNENTQERDRTTTTSLRGLVSSLARIKTQVTGFNLTGYSGDPVSTSTTEGNPLNSCPSGPWTLTTPAGDPVTVSESSTYEVNCSVSGGEDWRVLSPPA